MVQLPDFLGAVYATVASIQTGDIDEAETTLEIIYDDTTVTLKVTVRRNTYTDTEPTPTP